MEGVIIPLINDVILAEYRNVLSRPKFNFQHNIINDLIQAISNNAIKIQEKHIDIILPDEKDRVFYEVTMESNKTKESRLVTGNIKHFPNKSFIVTPKEMCDIILNDVLKCD